MAGNKFKEKLNSINEDQYKSPTRKLIEKQSMFRSSFGPSRSFGGIKGYGSFNKKISEALKIKDDLVGHDNSTVIPKGTEVKIHDPDINLPDIDWDGKTTNIDAEKLSKVVDKKELDQALEESLLLEQKSTIGAFLTSKIHEGYTLAADRAYASGYITQDERIALSSVVGEILSMFSNLMRDKYPNLYTREVDSKDVIHFRERIERRLSKI